ncbi:alkaline phosphatase family protein [Streptomyces sp. T028]|uniref:alkaline phosphatase family protein n=1 Tax=Streptomyces sp. T028 TaxID=3394379 RepID=UPI003A875EE8
MRVIRPLSALAAALSVVTVLAFPAVSDDTAGPTTPVRHFVYLMQGGRSFDNYFGAFPGADGIPAGACQPRIVKGGSGDCVRPFPLHGTVPAPLHPTRSLISAQVDGGRMDGFVSAFTRQGRDGAPAMGHYDERDLPFSWAVARENVLFDRFFSVVPFGVGAERHQWVAASSPPGGGQTIPAGGHDDRPTIFDRLGQAGVSWKFYVEGYRPDETFRSPDSTQPVRAPLLGYARFVDDPALRGHIADLGQYYRDLEKGSLPAVSYIASSGSAERSAHAIPAGQKLIRGVVTQLMLSRYWDSSALLWSYDGSGGWYDHVPPPTTAHGPRGLRVPAVLVSPYARVGHVDHTVLDSAGALRFIEDNWRLKPLTARDANARSIAGAFDFTQAPREPAVLPVEAAAPEGTRSVHSAIVYRVYGGAAALVALVLGAAVLTARRGSGPPQSPPSSPEGPPS